MDITPYIGPAIRARRELLGLSQEELAHRADLDRTYISGIERTRRNPSVGSLQRVAEAMAITLDVFFVDAKALAEKAASGSAHTRRVREKL